MPKIRVEGEGTAVPCCATAVALEKFWLDALPNKSGQKKVTAEMVANAESKFKGLAAKYEELGNELGVRWDLAYFQTLLDTNLMIFNGSAKADQFNFCALKGSGGLVSFRNLGDGVRACLEDLPGRALQGSQANVNAQSRDLLAKAKDFYDNHCN